MDKPPTFCLPLRTPISNDRIKLVPFDPDLHSATLVAETRDHPDIFVYTPSGPFATPGEFRERFFARDSPLNFRTNPAHFAFAVVDKTRPPSPEDDEGELAGLAGYLHASADSLSVEVGPVITFPRFQRSHVTSNAVGLLLQNAFAAPGEGGLGVVRVQWICNAVNLGSVKVAERMGFDKVGLIPWHWRIENGKSQGKIGNGKTLPPGSDPDDVWRDTLIYTMGWDLWGEKAREMVEKVMAR